MSNPKDPRNLDDGDFELELSDEFPAIRGHGATPGVSRTQTERPRTEDADDLLMQGDNIEAFYGRADGSKVSHTAGDSLVDERSSGPTSYQGDLPAEALELDFETGPKRSVFQPAVDDPPTKQRKRPVPTPTPVPLRGSASPNLRTTGSTVPAREGRDARMTGERPSLTGEGHSLTAETRRATPSGDGTKPGTRNLVLALAGAGLLAFAIVTIVSRLVGGGGGVAVELVQQFEELIQARQPTYDRLEEAMTEVPTPGPCAFVDGFESDTTFFFDGAALSGLHVSNAADRARAQLNAHLSGSLSAANLETALGEMRSLGNLVAYVNVFDWRVAEAVNTVDGDWQVSRPGYLVGDAYLADASNAGLVCSFRFIALNGT
ncbi:MAG: hypothetical protein KC561_12665, partial [Myxococcales bacterium]|nr:hypothetical protein [Myxococcales bacterium]